MIMMAYVMALSLARRPSSVIPPTATLYAIDVDARRILDLGCGEGASTEALYHKYPHADIIGLDRDGSLIHRARIHYRHLPIFFQCGDPTDIPYPSYLFDYIRLDRDLLSEHPERILMECHRLLVPHGVITID